MVASLYFRKWASEVSKTLILEDRELLQNIDIGEILQTRSTKTMKSKRRDVSQRYLQHMHQSGWPTDRGMVAFWAKFHQASHSHMFIWALNRG